MKFNLKMKLLCLYFLFGFHFIGYSFHLDEELKFKLSANEIKMIEKSHQFQSNDSSLYGKIGIGEDQIDVFNKFLKKQYPAKYKNYLIDFKELDYNDVNSLRDAWYKYLYGYILEDSSKIVNTTNKSNQPGDSNEKLKLTVKPDTGKFIFKVQIAACRIHLDENTLRAIYNGPERIIELYEENWYKYAISKSPTYLMARKIRDNIKVEGAFVIAYLNGTRIKITPAIAYKHHL